MENTQGKEDVINGFFGTYRFLTLEFETVIKYCGLRYNNAIALLQAIMTGEPKYYNQFENVSGLRACSIGKYVDHSWVTPKLFQQMLYEVNLAKFSQSNGMKNRLLETGDKKLVYLNYKGDTSLGVYNGGGLNLLGNALEVVRSQLQGNPIHRVGNLSVDIVEPMIYKEPGQITRYHR